MACLQEIFVPQENLTDHAVTVVHWCYANGGKVAAGQPVVELETSKAVFSLEAGCEGHVEYLAEVGQEVAVGTLLLRIHDGLLAEAFPPAVVPKAAQGTAIFEHEPLFSRGALELLGREGLSRELFHGRDFVSSGDVAAWLAERSPSKPAPLPAVPALSPASPPVDDAVARLVPVPVEKKREIKYLSDVQAANLCSSVGAFVDLDRFFVQVNRSMRYFQDSLLPVVLYESARLLKKYPELNGFFAGEQLGFYRQVHLGIAVDHGKGLKVVKVADADQKNLQQLEEEIFRLVNLYLDEKLGLEDLTGTTFTVTDLSAQGVHFFAPLVNARQSAILGIAAIDEKLSRCALTLTFDHRVTEGKKAGEFLLELKGRLESYRALPEAEARRPAEDRERPDAQCGRCLKSLAEDRRLQGPGFLQVVDHAGAETMVCRSCFQGW
jgi:pyruvate/2-oxoglutarate dehydrogenase complex dihydrolipoamide acyltransferase (E2) component